MTDEEYTLFKNKADSSGLSRQAFFICLIKGARVNSSDRLREAEKKTREAENRAERAEEYADFEENVSTLVMRISCGVLTLFLLLESVFHRGFWKDLFSFFYIPGRWLFNQWIPIIFRKSEVIVSLQFFGKIGITIAILGALAFIVWMIILTVKRESWLTIVVFIVSLGIVVILGDLFPFNRIIPVFVLMTIYHLVFWIIERKEQRSVSKK